MLDCWIRQQNLLIRRNPPHFSESWRRLYPPRPQAGRRRHDPPPKLRRIRLLLPRRFHDRRRHHHRQSLLHFCRNLQTVKSFQGEDRSHAGAVRRQAARLSGGEDRGRFHRRHRRRHAGELHSFLGGVGGGRGRNSRSFDRFRRCVGSAVLLRHNRTPEGGGSDAQELDHERRSAGRRGKP